MTMNIILRLLSAHSLILQRKSLAIILDTRLYVLAHGCMGAQECTVGRALGLSGVWGGTCGKAGNIKILPHLRATQRPTTVSSISRTGDERPARRRWGRDSGPPARPDVSLSANVPVLAPSSRSGTAFVVGHSEYDVVLLGIRPEDDVVPRTSSPPRQRTASYAVLPFAREDESGARCRVRCRPQRVRRRTPRHPPRPRRRRRTSYQFSSSAKNDVVPLLLLEGYGVVSLIARLPVCASYPAVE